MKIDKNYIAIVLIFVMFILYLNVTMSSPIVFGDEGYYAYQASYVAENKILPKYEVFKETDIFHPVFSRPPLFIVTESFWFLFGETAVKFMIPLFAMFTSFMLYIFLKKTVNEKAGIAAALLFMLTPSLITYGVLSYVDTLLLLLMTCSLYFGFMAIETNNKKSAVLAGIFTGLAILTKITAPIILVILGLYFLYTKKFDKWKLLAIIILISCIIVAPWIARNLALFGDVCYGPTACEAVTDTNIELIEGISDGYAGRTAGGGTESSVYKIGALPYTQFAYGWIIIFLALFGIAAALKEKSKFQILMIIMMICMIPIFILYSTRAEDAARYTLPVIIPMAALGGIFLADSFNWLKKKNFVIAIVLIILVASGAFYFGNQKLTGMQQVKAFSTGFFDACSWVQYNTPKDSLLLSVFSQQTAYNCERRTSTAIPDYAEIMLTYDDRSYQHLTAHGYDYIFVMVSLISQTPYTESIPAGFYNYMINSPKFENVFDNTETYGAGGVVIFKVL